MQPSSLSLFLKEDDKIHLDTYNKVHPVGLVTIQQYFHLVYRWLTHLCLFFPVNSNLHLLNMPNVLKSNISMLNISRSQRRWHWGLQFKVIYPDKQWLIECEHTNKQKKQNRVSLASVQSAVNQKMFCCFYVWWGVMLPCVWSGKDWINRLLVMAIT